MAKSFGSVAANGCANLGVRGLVRSKTLAVFWKNMQFHRHAKLRLKGPFPNQTDQIVSKGGLYSVVSRFVRHEVGNFAKQTKKHRRTAKKSKLRHTFLKMLEHRYHV